jgi:hypothetical protein
MSTYVPKLVNVFIYTSIHVCTHTYACLQRGLCVGRRFFPYVTDKRRPVALMNVC